MGVEPGGTYIDQWALIIVISTLKTKISPFVFELVTINETRFYITYKALL